MRHTWREGVQGANGLQVGFARFHPNTYASGHLARANTGGADVTGLPWGLHGHQGDCAGLALLGSRGVIWWSWLRWHCLRPGRLAPRAPESPAHMLSGGDGRCHVHVLFCCCPWGRSHRLRDPCRHSSELRRGSLEPALCAQETLLSVSQPLPCPHPADLRGPRG